MSAATAAPALGPRGRLLDRLRRFTRPPSRVVREASWSSERLLARVRLALCLLLTVLAASHLVRSPSDIEPRIGIVVAALALVVALLVLWRVSRRMPDRWLGFLSSAIDVSFVTMVLLLFVYFDQPNAALNNRSIYPVYLLMLSATALRYDPRICVVTGTLAMLEYGLVMRLAARSPALDSARGIEGYGRLLWQDQIDRLVLLAIAVLLATIAARRARNLLALSTRDSLTGLVNRRFFDEWLGAEIGRSARDGRPLALALIDIDAFKTFNDRFGHRAGDRALRRVADVLAASVRRFDMIARWGGDELIVALPGADLESTVERIEAARATIADSTLDLSGVALPPGVTISAGIACAPYDGKTAKDLLENADLRLYRAKREGRNRVIAD